MERGVWQSEMLSVAGADLGLSAVVFLVAGGDGSHRSGTMVRTKALILRLAELPAAIETVIFTDGSKTPDQLEAMLSQYTERSVQALACYAMATEAVKQVDSDVVTTGIDRSSLAVVRSPEIVNRAVLERALFTGGDSTWVSPTALVADLDGAIGLYGESVADVRRGVADEAV